jgi:hypothetical protein
MSEEYNDIDELLQIGPNKGSKLLFGSEFRFDLESDFDVMSSKLLSDRRQQYRLLFENKLRADIIRTGEGQPAEHACQGERTRAFGRRL